MRLHQRSLSHPHLHHLHPKVKPYSERNLSDLWFFSSCCFALLRTSGTDFTSVFCAFLMLCMLFECFHGILQSPQVFHWICLLRTRTTLRFPSSGANRRSWDHLAWMDTPLKFARMEVSPVLTLTRCNKYWHVYKWAQIIIPA